MADEQKRIDIDFFELFIIKNWDIEVLENIIDDDEEEEN